MSHDPNGPRLVDAFGFTADPSAYFPRLALESALAELVAALEETPPCAALIGEPGLGKTLLLHVLEQRLEGAFECVYVPFPRLDAVELWAWIAGAIGLARSEDDRAAVLRRARRGHEADGTGFVLLVDDAASLLPEPRIELIHACRTPGFALVMAFASADHEELASLPAHVRRIDLGPPMTLAETRAYVRARLRRVDPEGAISARLDPTRMSELHAASEGIPARLHALLDAWLRGAPAEAAVASPREAAVARPREPAEPVEPAAPREPEPEPPPVVELRPPRLAHAPLERRRYFGRRKRPRVRLALTALLLGLAAGLWFATQREPDVASLPQPAPPSEPPRAETAPAPAPEPAPAPIADEPPLPEPEPAAEVAAAEEVEVEPAGPPAPVESPAEAAPAPEPAPAPEAEPEEAAVAALPPSKPSVPLIPVEARPPTEAPLAALDTPPLAPPPPGPRLSVSSEPWAEIELDGKAMGETPLGELPISPGSHVVRAKLADGRVLEHRFDARSGDLYLVFP